jgi:hypothetical protein
MEPETGETGRKEVKSRFAALTRCCMHEIDLQTRLDRIRVLHLLLTLLHFCLLEEHNPSKAMVGRAIAQAVSRWLPTAAARVQTRV